MNEEAYLGQANKQKKGEFGRISLFNSRDEAVQSRCFLPIFLYDFKSIRPVAELGWS